MGKNVLKNIRKIHKATRKTQSTKKCVYFIERNKLGHHVFNSNFPDLHKKNQPREMNKVDRKSFQYEKFNGL